MIFAIHWHESAMDLHVFPIPIPPPTFLPIQSLWVFPVHQPWALVSCIQPGLVICFTLDSILVSMLFSQNIPPSPSPRVPKSLLYIYVSFSVLHIGLSLPSFKIPYTCVSVLYWSLSFWFTSLCIMGSISSISMSSSNCCFLTWIEISQEAGQVVWYYHLCQNFSTICCVPHSQKLWHSQ